jgi:hypothetical protein
MSNPNPKTEQLKSYQFNRKRPEVDDHETMRDMIKAGTDVEAFMLFWHQEADYTLQSARTIYYELKRKMTIDNGH